MIIDILYISNTNDWKGNVISYMMKKYMLGKIKDNKGITGIDATIAVVILMIFIPLVTSLFANIANMSKKVERKAIATDIAIQAIETAKQKINFNKDIEIGLIPNTEIFNGENGKYKYSENGDNTFPKGYEVSVEITKEIKGKGIEVIVKYLENGNEEELKLKTTVFTEI